MWQRRIVARGRLEGLGLEARVRSVVRCDGAWAFHEIFAEEEGRGGLHLWSDATATGDTLMGAGGASPSTNTLALKALGLAPGQSRVLEVAHVRAPGLVVERARQRYGHLGPARGGARFASEGLGRASAPRSSWTRRAWSSSTRGSRGARANDVQAGHVGPGPPGNREESAS